MTFSRKTALAAGITSLVLSAGLAPAASAAETDACPTTVLGTDATGDAKLYNAVPASSNMDISEVAIRTANKKTTVTFTMPTLDKTVPATSTALAWYFDYTLNDVKQFVAATLNPDGSVKYDTGTVSQTRSPTGATTGTFTESKSGKPGTISIQIPGLTSATKRYELTATRGIAAQAIGADTGQGVSAALLPTADTVTTDEHITTPCTETTTTQPAAAPSGKKASKRSRAARRSRR